MAKLTPAISVIIVNYNGKCFLELCLTSLKQQTFTDFEIILVDNGSTDGSVSYIQQTFPEVRLFVNSKNLGFTGGNNLGLSAARAKYICLLNNDVVTDPHWLEELKISLDDHPYVGFCASKILQYNQPDTIDTAGDIFYTCGVSSRRGFGEKDGSKFDRLDYVFGASACAAIYRRELFDRVGLFDEDFFAYCEDTDLSFRSQLQGFKCLYVPKAVIYHLGGGTLGHISDQRRYLTHRNQFYTLIKNMPNVLFAKYFVPISCYSILRDVSWIMQRKINIVWRARRDGFYNLKKMLQKRKLIHQYATSTTKYIDELLDTNWKDAF